MSSAFVLLHSRHLTFLEVLISRENEFLSEMAMEIRTTWQIILTTILIAADPGFGDGRQKRA